MTLIVVAASWIVILAVLILDFTGIRRRGTYFRWQGTGLLLMNSAAVVSAYAQSRGWSGSRLDLARTITFPVTLAGAAIFAIGVFAYVRARRNGEKPAG